METSWNSSIFGEADVNQDYVATEVFKILYRKVLKLESHPVVTRFWLFTECVWSLLLVDLLGLSRTTFTLTSVSARKESVKRLQRVQNFFSDSKTAAEIRKASICLQLTQHAVSITGQTKPVAGDPRPPLVRLAQCTVQKRTCQHMLQLIPLLRADRTVNVAETLQGLLTTEAHIIMRFERYSLYPGKLWRLCKKYNPFGYILAIQEFLETDDEELDYGYSRLQKADAWNAGSLSDAVTYMMSTGVQNEMLGFLERALANSLDAERKINQDKASETVKTSSVARASRNSILLRYRIQRERHIETSMKLHMAAKREKYMNYMAVARQWRPDLFPMPLGRRFAKADGSQQPEIAPSLGDADALEAYLETNREELKAEAARLRDQAKCGSRETNKNSVPYSNCDWLTYLDQHEGQFRELLRTASKARQLLNRRIVPEKALVAAPRMQPRIACTESPEWELKLLQVQPSFVSLSLADASHQCVVAFVAALGKNIRCVILTRASSGLNLYLPALTGDFNDIFLSRSRLVALFSIPEKSQVYKLQVRAVGRHSSEIGLSIVGQSLVQLEARVRKARGHADGGESSNDDSGLLSPPSSEADSVISDVEVEAADEAEEGCFGSDSCLSASDDDGVAVSGGPLHRADVSYVVLNNGYFTLSYDPKLPYCVMRIHPRWAVDVPNEGMGTKLKSKNGTLYHYGDTDKPTQTMLVLRAWMLHRFQCHGFAAWTTGRQKWLARETQKLAHDIEALGCVGGGTGSPLADKRIRAWAPNAMV